MLWPLFLVLLILWAIRYRWTRRRLYQLTKQIKCDLTALPIIGHAYMFIGGGTGRMKGIKHVGREANKHNGLTYVWLGPKLYITLTDPMSVDVVLTKCLEKDDVINCIRLGTGNGTIFAPAMVLGYQPNLQDIKDQVILKPFKECTQLCSERMFTPWLHPLAVYKMTPQYATFMKYKEAGYGLLTEIIESKKQACRRINDEELNNSDLLPKTDNNAECKSFVELLIDRGLNDLDLKEEALVLILGGTDTSAVGASYTAVMLSRHQDIQEKVYKELMEVLGDSNDKPIVANDLSRLKYLDAVIRETLRLHPPVPLIVRKVQTDLTLPSGITLVKGCGIAVNIWAVHRNPNYWGSDADEFRPERFFEDYNKRAFMPFSSGPRNCIGMQLAMMSMKTVMASLIRQYRVLPAEADIIHDGPNITYKPIEESFEIMMKDNNNFVVQLESR